MTIKEYNEGPNRQTRHAESFIQCLPHAIEKGGKETEHQLLCIGWCEEVKQTLLTAVRHYRKACLKAARLQQKCDNPNVSENSKEGAYTTFGDRLRNARKAKQLTQKELAAKIKAAHNSISNWENNQNMPDPVTIQQLCWALDVQPNYFFSMDPPQNRQQATLSQLSSDELEFIEKFRSLDERGQAVIFAVLEHEFNNADDNKTQE